MYWKTEDGLLLSCRTMEPTEDRIVYISRTETFSAAHRLFNEKLTDVENEKIFGKCSAVNGHGHNYKVRVTLRGPECIMDVLDHKNINMDVPHFRHTVPTSENIVIFIWNQLKKKLDDDLLYEVHMQSNESDAATYRGENAAGLS
ncbi:6-pyruvoyl tetrahydrobiopterin synthase-like isoform X2 [Haliotis rufescens]|uniref:6-pyruvoyl tetrahydrobiopterin synthase-like isoform X2 n=1 Tax=Haliotis rufescens TaxID=6454 RepID=UPI00201F58F1|nr:6-pyruvoyl tetrahydrobiopterin synthase-like isoform X2 [Haliotis rufescens]